MEPYGHKTFDEAKKEVMEAVDAVLRREIVTVKEWFLKPPPKIQKRRFKKKII